VLASSYPIHLKGFRVIEYSSKIQLNIVSTIAGRKVQIDTSPSFEFQLILNLVPMVVSKPFTSFSPNAEELAHRCSNT
jgi:hypothetical protein